jgi:acyl-CoA synthetase (AMP-forming)/AMP-acid ligase II
MKELVYHRQLLPAVEQHADKVAFHDGDYHATFGQHLDRVGRLCRGLELELGVQSGDRVAVIAANSHRFLELFHAAFLGAGVINPLNVRLSPDELAFILKDSGTKVVFTDFLFAGIIDEVRAKAGIDRVVLMGGSLVGEVPHDLEYEALLAAHEPMIPPEPEEEDAVVLMYTGGTTGLPKGVLLDQRAELLNLYHLGIAIGFDEERVFLHQTPMFHAASMGGVLGIPASGAVSVFVSVFEPESVLNAIERFRVDYTVMVPVMITMLLDHPAFRPERITSLRTLAYGASPMPTGLLLRLREEFSNIDLVQGYGMTEAAAVLTVLSPKDHRRDGDLLRSAGRPAPGVAISIQDEKGNPLPVGRTGEVCARAGNLMREYWERPDDTVEVFRDGWYHTGDAGYLDEQGYLYLVDRVKDMIITGGENVYSIEVENAIATHPAVAQVAVIGIPHDLWGEAVHAIVVLHPDRAATADELIAHARGTLAGYKLPKSVELRAEPLPLSGAMKPLKRELRRPYWEGHERAERFTRQA